MSRNKRKVLQIICGVVIIISFFAFAFSGFMAVGGGCVFLPIIPWFLFAFFGIMYGVVSSIGRRNHYSSDGYDVEQTTHKVNLRCPLCNAVNEENARYCNQCGERF